MVTTYQDLPGDPAPEISFMTTTWDWLNNHWQTFGAVGLGLVCLVMLRGMTKSTSSADSQSLAQGDTPAASASSAVDDEAEEEEELIRRFADGLRPKGPNLRAELASMVHEDPEAAVHVLQNWIGDLS
jgi:flagellar biosynthesis/type III secretory pathway M-ring protein FliF/YscJ